MSASIIICTFNEEQTVEMVVRKCCLYRPDDEVIVVDDGSTDKTPFILQELSLELDFISLRLRENRGKSRAMVRGIEVSSNDVILFFDADVSGIRAEHFELLIEPIVQGYSDMTLGIPTHTFINQRISPFQALTGERAMKKQDILPILDDIINLGFGIETYINLSFQSRGKNVTRVFLEGLRHLNKFEKTSPISATTGLICEGLQIAATMLNNRNLVVKRIMKRSKKNSPWMQKIYSSSGEDTCT